MRETIQDPRAQVRGSELCQGIVVRLAMVAVAALLALAVHAGPAAAAEPETEAAAATLAYIEGLQNADGGFPAFGTESAPGSTLDAAFAFIAAGEDPALVTNGGGSPVDYLGGQAASYAEDPGAAAKLALGVSAMGLNPADFGGVNLLGAMDAAFDPATGAYGLDLFDEALFVLALAAAGEPIPAEVVDHLKSVQQADGGWEFLAGFGADTNTTAFVLQALIASGVARDDASVQGGLGYLATAQGADGGFAFLPGSDPDPNSTAVIVQALIAAGEDVDAGGPWAPGGATALEGILSFFNPGTGAFQFFGEDSPFASYQAVPALMLAPFPELETRPDGEPAPMPSPTAEPTEEAEESPTPTATAEPEALAEMEAPSSLPTAGGAASSGGGGHTLVIVAGAAALFGAAAVIAMGRFARWGD